MRSFQIYPLLRHDISARDIDAKAPPSPSKLFRMLETLTIAEPLTPLNILKQRLEEARSKIEIFDNISTNYRNSKVYGILARRFDVSETIKTQIFDKFGIRVSNAYLKQFELLSYFPEIVEDRISGSTPEDEETANIFTHFDNAAFPGMFVMATDHYIKTNTNVDFYNWFASSYMTDKDSLSYDVSAIRRRKDEIRDMKKRGLDSSGDTILTDTYSLYENYRWKWLMDKNNNGDVTNQKNLEDFKRKVGKKIDLYTSDIGFSIEENQRDQEKQHIYVNLGQVVSGLETIKKGGWMMTKQFGLFEPITLIMIKYLGNCFEKIYICKPETSKPANQEIYLVCKRFRGSTINTIKGKNETKSVKSKPKEIKGTTMLSSTPTRIDNSNVIIGDEDEFRDYQHLDLPSSSDVSISLEKGVDECYILLKNLDVTDFSHLTGTEKRREEFKSTRDYENYLTGHKYGAVIRIYNEAVDLRFINEITRIANKIYNYQIFTLETYIANVYSFLRDLNIENNNKYKSFIPGLNEFLNSPSSSMNGQRGKPIVINNQFANNFADQWIEDRMGNQLSHKADEWFERVQMKINPDPIPTGRTEFKPLPNNMRIPADWSVIENTEWIEGFGKNLANLEGGVGERKFDQSLFEEILTKRLNILSLENFRGKTNYWKTENGKIIASKIEKLLQCEDVFNHIQKIKIEREDKKIPFNFDQLVSYGRSVIVISSSVGNGLVEKEYQIYQFIVEIEKNLSKNVEGFKPKNEMKKCLERFLIGYFNNEILDDLIRKFQSEITESKVGNKTKIPLVSDKKSVELGEYLKKEIVKLKTLLDKNSDDFKGEEIKVEGDRLTYKKYSFDLSILPTDEYNFLKSHSPSELLPMLMRYDAIAVSGGQQWSMPRNFFNDAYNNWNIRYIGFASPLNSGLISKEDVKYFSLFYKLDKPFNSLGNVFQYKGEYNGNIIFNPPFDEKTLENGAKLAIKLVEEKKVELAIFIMPRWENSKAYEIINRNKTEYVFLNEEKYYFESLKSRIIARFKSVIFLISKDKSDAIRAKFIRSVRDGFSV